MLTNMTRNDVIFKSDASPTLKKTVTVDDVVNSTVFLAELLYAGQVRALHPLAYGI